MFSYKKQTFLCSNCAKIYSTAHEFATHHRTDHVGAPNAEILENDVFMCTLCDRLFGSRENYDRHDHEEHPKENDVTIIDQKPPPFSILNDTKDSNHEEESELSSSTQPASPTTPTITGDPTEQHPADDLQSVDDFAMPVLTRMKSPTPAPPVPKVRRRSTRVRRVADLEKVKLPDVQCTSHVMVTTSPIKENSSGNVFDDEPVEGETPQSTPLSLLNKRIKLADNVDRTNVIELPYSTLHDEFIRTQLPVLLFSLRASFNCILFGVGSKYEIIDAMCEDLFKPNDIAHLRVNCHLRSINIKSVLISIIKVLNLYISTTSTVIPLTRSIVKYAKKHDDFPKFALVLDGLDTLSVRDRKTQDCISLLCTIKEMRLIGTIDHCNASLMWPKCHLARMNIRWFDATTYRGYDRELMTNESRFLGNLPSSSRLQHSLVSLDSLWESLTKNARRTLVILAENAINTNDLTITFWQLYQGCRSQFVISLDVHLRQLLVEFVDHRLIILRDHKTHKPGDIIKLCVDVELLKTFLVEKGEIGK